MLAGLRRAVPNMTAATADLIKRCDAIADGRIWDAEVEMSHVTADFIFRTVLSTPLDAAQARHPEFDS